MLYLASVSPRRRRILKELGISFRALRPAYHEKNDLKGAPSKIVRRHALAKARSAVGRVPPGVILAADTIVYFGGKVIGKPRDLKEAVEILSRLQGHWHWVYTGVAAMEVDSGKAKRKKVFFERTRVRLKSMSREEILAYFKKIKPLDKAGAYAIQSKKHTIIREIKGSFSNAVGFPVESFKKNLKSFISNCRT